ncbi:MAG: FlgD immunoglobulin-like domain containing protein [Candidatus Eisenbacteria bacterium]
MVIDSEAGESVVFGGYDGHLQVAFDNLWYYNLEEESWIPVAFPEDGWPLGRFGHAMVYDPDYHATVILGGSRPQVPCDEATVHVYVSDFDWYGATSGVTEGDSPIAPALSARAYPNPTNGIATITFDLAIGSDVDGAIYDASGARVATFDRQSLPAGHHELSWDGRDEHGSAVAAGVYFYQIRAGAFEAVGRLVNVQ